MSYMAPEHPIRGNKGIIFSLALKDPVTGEFGPAQSFPGDVKNVRPATADRDAGDITFLEAENGDLQDNSIAVSAVATLERGSLGRLLWDNPGGEFRVVWGPHNNAVATDDKPHFVGVVKAGGRPFSFEQVARKSTERASFDYTLNYIEGPELDTGVAP